MIDHVDVLLVAPDAQCAAGRSAAALGLWLSTCTPLRIAMVLDCDRVDVGPGNGDIAALAARGVPVHPLPVRRVLPRVLRRRGVGRAAQWLSERDRRRYLRQFAPVPVVIASGTASARVLRALPHRQRTLLCHLDEDDVDALARSRYLRRPILRSRLLVTTETAAARLRAQYRISAAQLSVQARFMTRPTRSPGSDPLLRAELGIPDDALVIGGVGTRDWWGDPGCFVDVAFQLLRARPQQHLHFLWFAQDLPPAVGPPTPIWPVRYDAAILGIDDRVSVSLPTSASRAGLCDLLILDTRPGQLPDVAIETCINETPILGYADVVPQGVAAYPDVDALVAQLLRWIDGDHRAMAGPPLVRSDAHLVDAAAPALLGLVVGSAHDPPG